MMRIQNCLNRRLSGREAAVVVAGALALAGAGYLAFEWISAKVLDARVREAMPKVCAAIREQRGEIVKAIEVYKAHFGSYPPDHVLSRQPLVVDPVTNTLFYELVGTIYNPTDKLFQAGGMEPAEGKYVKEFFQVEGFKNGGESAEKVTKFLKLEPVPVRQLHDDPDVFALGFQGPYEGIAPEVEWEFEAKPWRYVSSSPTNNPGKFDLWMELTTKKKTVVIGNWKAVE